MSADRLPDITRRLQEWKERPSAASNIAHGFDRLASWAFTAEEDIAWLLDRVRDLEAGIVTACQIGVRGTTGQEAQALASLMHDLNVPGVTDA